MNNRCGAMEWFIGDETFPYSIVFVTGTSRAGKSLFSRLMSTAENVEWIFEPFAIEMPVIMATLGQMDVHVACKEIVRDRILLRNANFRPQDMSSIYSCKEAENIFRRLMLEGNESIESYIADKGVFVILDIPNLLPWV